ncbi:MAG: protein-export chaperone SecB [Desulfuromonas sp.]|nr:protein-export chaperone SecB [Desulfuromonas sp.]
MAGSIVSSFQLQSYKIDNFRLDSVPNLQMLVSGSPFDDVEWQIQFKLRDPAFFTNDKAYVGGLDLRIRAINCAEEGSEVETTEPVESDEPLVSIQAGISGLFRVGGDGDRFDEESEQRLAKLQIPALLFPYLRAAVTSMLANAGFGSVMLPLINLHAAASKEDIEIQIFD